MENKKHDEDTKAILARREAFIKKVLSNEEKGAITGGLKVGAIIEVPEPCLSPTPNAFFPGSIVPEICLSPS